LFGYEEVAFVRGDGEVAGFLTAEGAALAKAEGAVDGDFEDEELFGGSAIAGVEV